MDPKLFQPPVLIGERVVWLGSGSGVPQSGYVRWIGRLPEMGPGWTLGLELDNPLPYGGIDGTWGNRHLFTCETKHGLLVPATKTMKESKLLKENGFNYVKSKKPIPETPFEAVTKFCPTTDLVTCDIPRPAIRRKKHLLLQQIEQEKPIAPKRRTKFLAKQSLLPKIYETSPTPPFRTLPCAVSSSSLNNCGTIKSLESHATFESFPASYGTLKSSISVYGTLKSSVSEYDISKYSLSASLCSLTSFNTLRTCRSDEYTDYQWFDAKDKCEDIFKCKYHSLEKGDASIKNKCHIIEGQQIRLIESKYCRHIEIKTPPQNGVSFERMNGIKRQKKVCEDDDDDNSSYEDATSTIERTCSESGSCPRKDKTTSGFFSFLRWFKKNKESADERNETLENNCNVKEATVPSSPEFVRNISSSCGSIDTIFSTATVNSFAFVTPTLYRPFGYANPVEKGIIVEPDTDTYRNRIDHRDRVRELDKNLTLRKKYHLYSSDTLLRTTPETSPFLQRKNTQVKANVQESENIHVQPKKNSEVKNQSTNTENQVKALLFGSSERKKRRAPDPPSSPLKDNILSNSLDSRNKNTSNATNNEEQINIKRTRHRRTVSDSAKDKKAGAFCHVKGKRKAPLPPTKLEATSSLGRKKRPAPQPPQEPREERRSTIGYLTPEEKERLISNIDKLRAHAEKKSMEQASIEQVICNDSLRLEKGVLRPNKDVRKTDTDTNSEKKTAPVSPRPWYKRSITNKDSVSGLKKDIFKSLEKKKEREKEKTDEWMPEVGFPRITSTSTNNRFSIFSRSEEKKAEGEKRKSQISMLANISELDREAAEIVQKEQAREQALVAAEDAKFYSYTEEVPMMGYGLPNSPTMPSENVEVPKRSSARELISLFNAIGNVTKVTVNSTFFSKEEIKKRFSFMSENLKTVEQTITVEEKAFEQKTAASRQSLVIDFNSPPSSRKKFENVTSFQTSPEVSAANGVTITEIKEQTPTKPRAFHSPNPSIPTITEQSESAASTPGDVTKTVIKNTSEVPEALSHAKRVTIWSCPRCTLENPSWKITCEACGRWRPTFSETPHNGVSIFSNTNSSYLFPDNTKGTDFSASANAEQDKAQDANSENRISPKQVAISGTSLEIKAQNKSEDNSGMGVVNGVAASVTAANEKEIIMKKYLGKPDVPKSSLNHQSDNFTSKSEENKKNVILKDNKYISASNFKKESIKEEKTATVSDIQKEETVNLDEVRMARLAFFNNAETYNMDTNNDKPVSEKQKTIHDADERARLKEMLKEMKNSLPKRPNKSNVGMPNKDISNNVKKHENDEGRKLGAIKKVINKSQDATSQIPAPDNNNNKSSDINAVIITTKTVYDDIKVKRNSSSKSPKVSTSVQTNAAIVQKLLQDDPEKKKISKIQEKTSSAEVIVPITVEEFSGTGIKDGVLYTSLKKDSRRLGKGTFELIHAKDFANIEATKTGSENIAVHVYANLPPTLHSPSPSVQQKHQAKPSNGVISDDSKSMQVPSPRPDSNEVEKLTVQLTFQKGIDDFKADLKASPPEKGMNTLAINRLLRRLEMAIVNGEHNQAAILAKDLAKLKINCSVIRQRQNSTSPSSITVDMYVEDKISHQGPIPLQVIPTMSVGQLKQKVQKEFEIPAGVQRWILGKLLASDDTKTLADHNVNTTGCPLFLYLVAPDGDQDGNTDVVEKKQTVENVEKPTENNETANRAGGWFYNDEEDRYSFCEDTESSEEEPEEEIREDVKEVANPTPVVAAAAGDEDSDDDDDEEEETEDENELENAAAVVVIHEKPVVLQAPVVAAPFVPPKVAKESSPQVTKLEEEIAAAPRREAEKSSTLRLGWKCPTCTLVNSPTRPGCAACTTERPHNYIIPKEYQANDRERLRLRQEQTLDNHLQQARDEEKRKETEKQQQSYLQLVNLDKEDLVPNAEPFDCSVCLTQYNIGEGVVLRECLHTFCRTCLVSTVQFSEEAEVKCPYRDADYACASALQEREIKALVPREVYEQHLAKSVAQAENKIGNAFHCKTPDCRGWCIFEDNVNEFKCPVCRSTNCLTCQAIHDGMNCKQYQEQMNQESETNADARRTKEMLEEMVERGEAMNCPTCQVVLMKKWGCDWLRCSMCKTEICWVTRGPRWGPAGKGDTSGGCQCGLNGIKCHPRCNYCH